MTRGRVRHTTVPRVRARHTTVPRERPVIAPPPRHPLVSTVEEPETSLLDVLDSLLNKGVVLNADVILALADVDLVYLRLSALLCAADRVFDYGSDHGSGKARRRRGARMSRVTPDGTRIPRISSK